MHSTASDGLHAPADLVARAAARGLTTIALTDHDTVDGWSEAQAAAEAHAVRLIPGIELSITVANREIHLLGYGMDLHHAGFRAYLDTFRSMREARAEAMVDRLQTLDVPVTMHQVRTVAQGGMIGRPHVAAVLVQEGVVETMGEAFASYLGNRGPAHVPKDDRPVDEALRLLHEAGGVGVLAHPGHAVPDFIIRQMIAAGLDGIETIHPSHDSDLTAYFRSLVRGFDLIETGGSDYHGSRPQDDERLGGITVSDAIVAGLDAAIARVRAA